MNNRKGNNPELGILRKGSYSDLTRSKEFETNNNSTKFSKRETNTSNYKQIIYSELTFSVPGHPILWTNTCLRASSVPLLIHC